MGPYIGAVVGDEDGDVADEADAALAAVIAEGLPLLAEAELDDALDFELRGEVGAEFRDCFGAAVRDLLRPGGPGGGGVLAAEDVEENEVLQPAAVFLAVFFEGLPLRGCVLGEEAGGGLLQQRHLGGADLLKVDPAGMRTGSGDVLSKFRGG